MTTETITATMKNGEKLTSLTLYELFPVNNSEFARANDYIEITTDEFTIHVSSCFLLTTASGNWSCDVLSGDGSKFRTWNGKIYSGNVVYMNNIKFTLNEANVAKFNSIINFRKNLIAALKAE